MLERHGLSGYVDLFRADYLAFGDVTEQVARWWDLRRLQRPLPGVPGRRRPGAGPLGPGRPARPVMPPGEAFADYVRALTAWRRLPFLDPGLPAELLPGDWNGLRAAEAFAALRSRLAEPARAHARAVIGTAGGGAGQGTTA